MMRVFVIILVLSLLANPLQAGKPMVESWILQLRCQPHQYSLAPLTACTFSWQVFAPGGQTITGSQLTRVFQDYVLTIQQADQEILKLQLPANVCQHRWLTPPCRRAGSYQIKLGARLRTNPHTVISHRITLRVSPPGTQYPASVAQALKTLMDYHGRRGYYQQMGPAWALERAQQTCDWLIQQADPAYYSDSQQIIDKIKHTRLASWDVYCPVWAATLTVQGWFAGRFLQLDRQRNMYHVRLLLPVEPEKAYTLEVAKGRRKYRTAYTHSGPGEFVVDQLEREITVRILTPQQPSRIMVDGFMASPEWRHVHQVRMVSNYRHEIKICRRQAPALYIALLASHDMTLRCVRQEQEYVIVTGRQTYRFHDRHLELVQFQ